MDSIHKILQKIRGVDGCALATVIKVEGSAYRKEGTTMLFTADGVRTGLISAGCLEEDLAIRADQLLNGQHQSDTIVYDMRSENDLSWGRGAGCNGKVHVLLESVDEAYKKDLLEVKRYLDNGTGVTVLKIMEDNDVKTVFISEERHIFGNRQGVASKWMGVALKADQSGLTKYQGTSLFTHHFKPHPRLFIFGGGPDVQPLARMADMAGFAVNVWDWRPDMLKQHFFPDVQLLEGAITGIIPAFNFRPTDAAIIMTHDFQKDKEILNLMLAQKHIGYLGVLGPRKRTTRLLANGAIPDHLHSPVGFKIGAEGPEEIAISIIAELIQTKRVAEKAVGGTRLREAKANES